MAQFYTLEEAARVLGMSPEELKSKAQAREVRAFMDSGSWRFRQADIDELARRRGMGSDPDLSLSDLDLEVPAGSGSGSEEMMLSEFQLGTARPDLAPPSLEIKSGNPSDQDILLSESSVPPDPLSGSSSTIIGMKPAGKQPSDSDVRLVPDQVSKGASDSDVRLAGPPTGLRPGDSDVRLVGAVPGIKPSDSDVTLVSDDTSSDHSSIDLAAKAKPKGKPKVGSGSGSDETTIAKSPLLGSSGEVPAVGGEDSDFELTPSSVIDALQPESGSDFELTALDASDEFEATPMPRPSDSDVTAAEPSTSGINLARPSDSGINLQAVGPGAGIGGAGGFDLSQADSIELAPLDEDTAAPPRPAAKPAAAKKDKADLSATALPTTAKKDKADLSATALPTTHKSKDLLSATALPMKKPGEKDIFEDTDFEVDALDSDEHSGEDRTVQLEAASDFDLDDSDSASEVFAIDEEDVDQNAATAMAPAVLDEDEGAFSDAAAEGVSGEQAASAWDVEDTSTSAPAARAASPVLAAAGPQAEWGGLWVGFLGAATFLMLILAFVGMDMVRNVYEFHEGGPGAGLVSFFAGLLGS
jgi:hypothetical protein